MSQDTRGGDTAERVLDLCKRRGFLYPAFEVYGGMAGFYDYGPLGAAMKHRFEELWRRTFRDSAVPVAEVHCPNVTPHVVLKASGHVDEFSDLVTKCGKCGHLARADHLVEEAGYEGTADALSTEAIDAQITELRPKCPSCGKTDWSPATPQNLMFQTEIGPGSGRTGYLRPETAQGIFTDFPHLLRFFRGKLPFAGLQVGTSNRNEISPRQGMLRLREFNMMEAEVFFADTNVPFDGFDELADDDAVFVPGDTEEPRTTTFRDAVISGMVANQALAYFLALTQRFLVAAGMDRKRLRLRQHLPDEMAHYASDCWDAEFQSDRYGWVECVGVADRGCFDLQQHAEATGKWSDFQVTMEVPPITFQAVRRTPVMGVLGKTFKADAKAVAAAMEEEWQAHLRSVIETNAALDAGDELVVHCDTEAATPSGPWTVAVGGHELEVPPEGYTVQEGTWTVTARKIVPRVIEPSFGVDRIIWALWEHAYTETEKEGEAYVRLRLSPHVAPVQVAVLPLTNKDGLPEVADRVAAGLRRAGLLVDTDASGNIGRRYARQDEVGTPVCITVDNESLQDDAVTVRDRDSTEQVRVPIAELVAHLHQEQASAGFQLAATTV